MKRSTAVWIRIKSRNCPRFSHTPDQKLLYCPPVYGICDDTLYLLCNTMVSADHMHSMEFYRYDESDGKFHFSVQIRSPSS